MAGLQPQRRPRGGQLLRLPEYKHGAVPGADGAGAQGVAGYFRLYEGNVRAGRRAVLDAGSRAVQGKHENRKPAAGRERAEADHSNGSLGHRIPGWRAVQCRGRHGGHARGEEHGGQRAGDAVQVRQDRLHGLCGERHGPRGHRQVVAGHRRDAPRAEDVQHERQGLGERGHNVRADHGSGAGQRTGTVRYREGERPDGVRRPERGHDRLRCRR